jgi:glucose/arabinose dehydrogenase
MARDPEGEGCGGILPIIRVRDGPTKLSGYKLVFVPFANGRPSGLPRGVSSGFLALDEKVSYGRPVGVVIADDVGDVIWRVTGA